MESGRHVADTPRTAPKRKMKPLWLVIVIDILLAGVILCTFSLFHHVIPSMNAMRAASVKPSAPTPTVAVTPAAEETSAASEAPAVSEAPVDNRTEWQKKFAEHFTDEIVVTPARISPSSFRPTALTSTDARACITSRTFTWPRSRICGHIPHTAATPTWTRRTSWTWTRTSTPSSP